MKHTILIFLWLACSLSLGDRAAKSYEPGPAAPAAADPVRRLRADLDGIFSDRRFSGARWGVEVFSLDRSEKIYERDAKGLYVPASNNKIITAAAALLCLGPDYRYETRLLTDGRIVEGRLRGNLVIVGTGDPFHSPLYEPGDPFVAFRDWAARLKAMGVSGIDGDIIGDSAAFEATGFGLGWEWNDLGQGFAAPVGALQFHDNMIALEISPGAAKGDPASIRVSPFDGYLNIDNRVLTDSAKTPARIKIGRGPSRRTVVISGSVPAGGDRVLRNVSVYSPAHYYLSALKHVLSESGIDTGNCRILEKRGYGSPSLSELWIHRSPALRECVKQMMKASQNLYAETLVRTLGLTLRGEGSFEKGKDVVEKLLEQMGVEKENYVYADGSGLSRLNLTSPEALVKVLRFMSRDKNFVDFYDALPVAGVDGTLAERMKNTRAANSVRAKTGSLANISAISGYVRTADGEAMAFAILANNFVVPRQTVESAQDKALERLAVFSRK